MGGLSVSNLVKVTVSLTPTGASALTFGILMIAGDSNVINGVQRFRTYTDFDSVENDFGTTAPETLAADLFFSQSPQPSTLMVGRWFSTASAAQNVGGILSPTQQLLSNFTSIGAGSFAITVDGTVIDNTGLDFTACTNLNAVATVITTGLSGGIVCTWTGENFVITSSTTGTGAQATGTVTFTSNPTSGSDTVTLNGLTISFVSGAPSGNQVQWGSTKEITAAAFQTFLQNSVNADLTVATYSTNLDVTTITYKTIGTAGNSYSLAKSSASITISGGDLAGGTVPSSVGYASTYGSGTDISAQLMLTSSTSQGLIPGFAAETPVQCATALAAASPLWYGLEFASTTSITDDQNVAVAGFIEAQDITRVFGVTITNTNVLSSLVSTDLASRLLALGYNQSTTQYSSTNPYAVSSLLGRAFSVDFTANNTTITLMFKQEPGVVGENLTQAQAATLKAKNCNVFVDYVNSTVILQYGTMASGQFFDTIQGIDWLQNAIQTAVYNVLYTSTTKIPQTDAGVNQLTNAIAGVCEQGVANGLIAGGTWNAAGFGSLVQGQYLKSGYYIYATPLALQSESARATRVAPPIQVAVKLAGAIQSVDVLVSVNQ